MAKPKVGTKPKSKFFDDPEDTEAQALAMVEQAQSLPPDPPKPAVTAPVATLSKSDAMRKALAAGKTKPTEAVQWIREQFGLEVGAQYFSTFKATEEKKGTPKSKPVTGKPVQSDIELALQVKELVQRVGAEQLKQWIEVVS